MKKRYLAPYCVVLIVGNCIVPSYLRIMGLLMQGSYHYILEGKPLPPLTQFALILPPWFYVFTALSILAGLGLFIQRVSASLLAHWLLVVCILESVALFFFAWGICRAFFYVGWGLSG
jgi:hypothetical protein